MRVAALLAAGLVAACASSSSPQQTTNKANPCATKGATYLLHLTQRGGGTCGAVPDQIFNVNPDGTLGGATLSCDSITQEGCTARDSGCTTTSANGVTCRITTDVTFTDDGSSASGLETTTCTAPDGSGCGSTYSVSAQRQ